MSAHRLLDQFQISRQLDAGPDGIRYQACRKSDNLEVDVRVLTGLESNGEQRERIAKRVRLAAMLKHAAVAKVLLHDFEAAPPSIVMEPLGSTSLLDLHPEISGSLTRSLTFARDLTASMAEAHRLGLTHGSLGPSAARFHADGRVRFDFSGLRTEPADKTEMDRLFRSGEASLGGLVDNMSNDVFSAGCLLTWLFTGEVPKIGQTETCRQRLDSWSSLLNAGDVALSELTNTLADSVAEDPDQRPLAADLAASIQRVADVLVSTQHDTEAIDQTVELQQTPGWSDQATQEVQLKQVGRDRPTFPAPEIMGLQTGQELGRYRIIDKLGQGGMGAVYRAEDLADGAIVAVKVMHPALAENPQAFQRFRKEARLLAHANNPNVANLIEVNHDGDLHYLAMEFVAGTDLERHLAEHAPLDEAAALELTAGVARALVGVHQRGIVHRDIKPANILLVAPDPSASAGKHRVKLTDFGLARQVEQSVSLELTKTGLMVGTPKYMAPEQFQADGDVTPATDVYSLGVTLYEMLTGRLPYEASNLMEIVQGHCKDPVPPLRRVRPEASEQVERIVARAMSKEPQSRYADAGHLLDDLDRLLRGEPSSIQVHPVLPPHDPKRLFRADFQWSLNAPPEQLWPFVSNTERINCAVGVPSVKYSTHRDETGVHKLGAFRMAGLEIAWEEFPFEWIEGQRLGVLRIFSRGPFKWFLSIVETLPRPGGGTTLNHRVRIEPRGIMGKLVAKMEVDIKGKPALEKVYRRIDDALCGKLGDLRQTDPYVDANALPRARQQRLEQRLSVLAQQEGVSPEVVEQLGTFLAEAPAQELARIRPLVLAESLRLQPEQVVNVCLHAVKAGLLVMHWDILCPTCRIPSDYRDTLRQITEHAYCEVCDLDFELDFGRSLELVFRADPEIRQADLGTYCIGGPEHSPHVVAQLRFAPEESIELNLQLNEGVYLLRGPQLPYTLRIDVQPVVGVSRARLDLTTLLRSIVDPCLSNRTAVDHHRQQLSTPNAAAFGTHALL